MTNFSALTKETQSFIQSILNGGTGYTALFSLAVARAVAYSVPMPSSPVEDYENYYNMTDRMEVQSKLGLLNELFVLNFPVVEKAVANFLSQRYAVLYPPSFVIVRDDQSGVLDCFSIRRYFSDSEIASIQAGGKQFMVYTNEVAKIIKLFAQNNAAA